MAVVCLQSETPAMATQYNLCRLQPTPSDACRRRWAEPNGMGSLDRIWPVQYLPAFKPNNLVVMDTPVFDVRI